MCFFIVNKVFCVIGVNLNVDRGGCGCGCVVEVGGLCFCMMDFYGCELGEGERSCVCGWRSVGWRRRGDGVGLIVFGGFEGGI